MRREVWSAGGAALSGLTILVAFAAGLAATLISSELFARGLTRLGTKLGLSEGLLGLLAAVGADSPELSSAVAAILAGAGGVGVGVVVGSNLFNLAALLGLPAVVARGVLIRRAPLVLDAVVAIYAVVLAGAMVASLLPPWIALLLEVPVAAAYVVVLATPRRHVRRFHSVAEAAPRSVLELAYEVTHDIPVARHGSWTPVAVIPFALAGVVGGSFVMVREALAAQSALRLSDAVIGTIVLASLTSLPNLWVALHFARTNRGTALFSSAMNSNTINLVGGLMTPASLFGVSAGRTWLPYLSWLLLLTIFACVAPLRRGRLSPVAGGLIIALYVVSASLTVIGRVPNP